MKCPAGDIISWQKITYSKSPCQDTISSDICLSYLDDYFNQHCYGKNNCTFPIDMLSYVNCQRPPRRLEVNFECNSEYS